MAFENLIQVTFTDEALKQIDEVLQTIENLLKGKTVNLTPDQRRQYGSIAEQNKLFVNKSKDFMEQYPQYVPNFLDKEEFDRDFKTRQQIETRLQRFQSLVEQLSDTKVLLDHDNYFNALTFYRNIKFLSKENIPGIKSVHDGLSQFFKSGKRSAKPEDSGATADTSASE
ncbi:hypothetical protein [Capnocytophaga canimorsus]|uniref:hypothetical protein n=1 Tax=Capnocytophaga canimorsus TaxID=28188 RepID=UPI001EDD3BA8|nr:hypothetical protein [Capnocytophaga canimorsus]GJQ05383.1 hypothetical protein CAPN009_17980 [Capnocytophaga canimorsus]